MMVGDSFVSFLFFFHILPLKCGEFHKCPALNFDILLSCEAQSSENNGSSLWSIKLVFFP